MHVIICTDNQGVIEAVGRSIAGEAGRVSACESGMELLAAVRALAADLVVLDLDTPGMNGLLLVSAVQQLQPKLPIVAVSGRAMDVRPLLQRGVRYVALNGDLLQPLVTEVARQAAAAGAPAR
ncbi:MAG: response regulator [Candidatus Methylomirabilales bacterium]